MHSSNLIPIFLVFFFSISGSARTAANTPQDPYTIIGRWDITFDMHGSERPGWLEVSKSGNSTLVGRVMVIGGSARPISEVHYNDDKWRFTIPVQWERGGDLTFEMTLEKDVLTGTMLYSDGKTCSWAGVRAPLIRRQGEPVWGSPIALFNGYSISGWHPSNPTGENQWVVKDGILTSPHAGSNLITDEKFEDFKLHIEFRYLRGGNSGVYLRGRYEVQIEDSKGKDPERHLFSAVYGLLPPNEIVAKDPGEWQSFDITLVGRRITVVANGVTVICDQEIPGLTGGALDSHETEPGPIFLQGDHQPIEYRNIVITPGM